MEATSVNLWTALVTPFASNGEVNQKVFEKLIDHQLEAGVKGILLFGSTGEAATLSLEEKARLATRLKEIKKDALMMIGVTHNDTKTFIEDANRARDWGADVLLAAPPYYNKPTPSGIIQHFKCLHEKTDLPIVLYNVPSRIGVSLTFDIIKELATLPRVVGLKEASADPFLAAQAVKEGLTVWSGDDPLTLSYMSVGALGAISVCSNAFPREHQEIVDLAGAGDWVQARAKLFAFLELYPAVFSESNPLGIKAAMVNRGLIENVLRLPLVPMSTQNTTQLNQVMATFSSSSQA